MLNGCSRLLGASSVNIARARSSSEQRGPPRSHHPHWSPDAFEVVHGTRPAQPCPAPNKKPGIITQYLPCTTYLCLPRITITGSTSLRPSCYACKPWYSTFSRLQDNHVSAPPQNASMRRTSGASVTYADLGAWSKAVLLFARTNRCSAHPSPRQLTTWMLPRAWAAGLAGTQYLPRYLLCAASLLLFSKLLARFFSIPFSFPRSPFLDLPSSSFPRLASSANQPSSSASHRFSTSPCRISSPSPSACLHPCLIECVCSRSDCGISRVRASSQPVIQMGGADCHLQSIFVAERLPAAASRYAWNS